MKEQLFTQRGGARRGSANYTWLFERLTILKDGLILSGTKIPKENIEKLSIYNGIFTAGLRIDRKSNKELLVFWTLNFRALKDALLKAGYSLDV